MTFMLVSLKVFMLELKSQCVWGVGAEACGKRVNLEQHCQPWKGWRHVTKLFFL